SFPNHHPDPSDPANLQDLIHAVRQTGADLGLAFDGDGDRLGVVSRAGEIIYPDRLLMLFARDVLSSQPGGTVIYDVKCTSHLKAQILDAGGSPLMWRTGHSLIKAKMRETGAELAEGEHYRFMDRLRERASFEDASVIGIDGLRVDWPDGWGLVRASNTTPVLVLRFEADNEEALKRIQQVFRRQMLAVDPALKLPF